MKKSAILALAAMMLAGNAQASGLDNFSFNDDNYGFSVIGQFGLNISNIRANEIPAWDMNPKAGFNLAVHGEYILPECYGVYVNAGLDYSMKGGKSRIEAGPGSSLGADYITRPMYLSVPIHVGYRYDVMEDLGVYADLGPYFALGTNGKCVTKLDDYSEDIKTSFFGNKSGDFYKLQRTEFGFGFRVGAEYAHHYNLIVSCDWGVTDMLTQSQKHDLVQMLGIKSPYLKNFAAGITFGYRF